MTLDIQSFRNKLENNTSPAPTNRFLVEFFNAPTALSNHREYIKYFCESAELPPRSLQTIQNKIYGPARTIAYGSSYIDTTMTFICTSNGLKEKRFFDSWQDNINNPIGYDVKYYDQYTRDITLTMYNDYNEEIYKCTFKEAFPTMVGSISLSSGAQNETARLSVTFAFHRWERDKDTTT